MIQCPNKCGNAATIDPTYGAILCTSCQKKPYHKLTQSIEFTSEDIKRQRKEYGKDTIPPFRKGELSKEYIDLYGAKRLGVSDEEIKKAKNVWNGSGVTGYYNN